MDNVYTSQSVGVALTLSSLFYGTGCQEDTTNGCILYHYILELGLSEVEIQHGWFKHTHGVFVLSGTNYHVVCCRTWLQANKQQQQQMCPSHFSNLQMERCRLVRDLFPRSEFRFPS